MFITNNILMKIIFLLITIVFSIGLSVHPLLVNEVFPSFSYLKLLGKIILIISFSALFIAVVKKMDTIKIDVLVLVFLLLIVILSSIYQIIINNILVYPSIIILFIFVFIYILFYVVYFTKNKVYFLKEKKHIKNIKKIINIFTIFLIFSLILEILVKYSSAYIDMKILLRDSGNIVFPWRLTGFMLDANRWAVVVLFMIVIFSYLKKELKLTNNIFEITLYIYLLLTLSKTSFFILLLLLLFNIHNTFKTFSFKSFFIIVLTVLVFLSSLLLIDYDYKDSALERRIDFTVESMFNPSKASTLNEREETYIAAINSIGENLLVGKGYLNFVADTSEQKGISVHNTPLALMAYFGAFYGLFIYILIFILPLLLLFFKYKWDKELLKLLFITVVFFNMISVAHDLILILMYYITLTVYEVTKRIKRD